MRTIAFLLCLCYCFAASAQNTIGLPEIIGYTKQAYGAGTQNWDIKQDSNGIVYFGNNEGLLSFDGTFWNLYRLPNRTIIRAIEISKDGKIYIGGQNELGYFLPDKFGKLQYHSLLGLIPKQERSFDDVWNICTLGNSIFFRTNRRIFQLSDNVVTVYPTTTEWRFMAVSNRQLIAQDLQKGILVFENGIWAPLFKDPPFPPAALVTAFVPLGGDRSLLTTLRDGIFLYQSNQLKKIASPDLATLSAKMIYKAIAVDRNHVAIATSFDGCHIIDETGKLIQSLTHEEGVQTNSVRSIFQDKDNNLWLGLDNGIDFVAYNNAIKHIYPEKQNIGSGYSALFFQNQLYLGTTNGLYTVPLDDLTNVSYTRRTLTPVSHSEGQVWSLSTVNNQLFMGHHEGAFQVANNQASLLDNKTGFWTFLPASNVLPSSLMVAGNYLGLSFYNFTNGHFQKAGIQAQFESARFIVVENEHSFWVAHPYKGLYRVQIGTGNTVSVKLYNQNNGLVSPNNNYVFKVKNRLVAATEKGIYEYNSQKDAFEASDFFKEIFHGTSIRYLKEDPLGNIWFVHEKELGVVDFSEARPRLIYFPELNGKLVSGFENIYPLNEHNIFIGSEKGFYHVDFDAYKRNTHALQTQLRMAKAIGKKDTTLFGGYGTPPKTEVSYQANSLHFEYSAILYGQQPNIEYSYYLDGFDHNWSAWLAKTEKDYTNLPAGHYVFQVKARTNLGNESAVYAYSFTILPPWYQTTIAYAVYVIAFLCLIFFLHRWQKKKFLQQQLKYEEQQRQLQYLHQLELEKNEKEIVKLRNEKLEAELAHKNTELASSAMHLVQKGELLSKIKEELVKLNKDTQNEKSPEEVKKIIKILGTEEKMDEDWEVFAQHFDKVHSDFLRTLKKQYPSLTPNDSKLCAYLRMNLSTKEIAQLMNISVRGVEISRYRLRKKLELPTSVNLFDFLLNIDESRKAGDEGSARAELN